MSYLSEEIERQMQSENVSVDQLAAISEQSRGQIYRWLNADQTSISAGQLDAISSALSKDPLNHAKLLVAHLLDERVGSARDLVRVEMDATVLQDRPQPRTKGELARQFIAEQCVTNRGVNDLIIDLARVLGAKI